MSALPFVSALLLTAKPLHAKQDKASLQRLKLERIQMAATSAKALRLLRTVFIDLIILDADLEDMSGTAFLRRFRKDPSLRQALVIMVTAENRREKVLDAIGAGVAGYILRPYALATFERHLRQAKRTDNFTEIEQEQVREGKDLVEAGAFDEAIEAFEDVLTESDEARRYYELGMGFLMNSSYGKAIIAFKKAVQLNDLYAEAHKGLAQAYKGKGDDARHALHLQKAAEIFASQDRLDETKDLFIQILKYENKAANPFNTLGVKLRRAGNYQGAIHAYKRAIELTPDNEAIYYNIAKASLHLGDADQALRYVSQALSMKGDFPEALALYEEITGHDYASRGLPGSQATPSQDLDLDDPATQQSSPSPAPAP